MNFDEPPPSAEPADETLPPAACPPPSAECGGVFALRRLLLVDEPGAVGTSWPAAPAGTATGTSG
eukprot:11888892-Prorocentrum_lima.AAC.1